MGRVAPVVSVALLAPSRPDPDVVVAWLVPWERNPTPSARGVSTKKPSVPKRAGSAIRRDAAAPAADASARRV